VSGAWSTNANWTNNLVGTGANVTADFSQVDLTSDIFVTNDVSRTIGNMMFGDTDNSTAGSWVLTNNTITLAGATPTITVNALGAGSQVMVRSVVAGTSGLTKAGPGFLTLSGANTYTGGTVVSNGVLNFNNEGNLGTLPGVPTPGNITLNGGALALVTANQNVTANRGVALGINGGTISNAVASGGNLTVSGVIAGPGALTVGVASTAGVILNGQNTYNGGTTLVGPATASVFTTISTVGLPGSLVSGPFGTGPVTFNGPGTRSTTGADTTNGNAIIFAADTTFPSLASEKTLTLEGPVTLSGGSRTLTVNVGTNVVGKSLTINGVIGDGGNNYALTKAGTGNLVLSAANTYTGGTTNSGGVLILNNNSALSSGALVTTNGNTRVTINDGITITNDIIVNGGGVVSRGIFENSGAGNATLSGSPITINAPLFAGGHFASTGGGTLTVAKPVNSSVAVSIRTGTVIMSGGGSYTGANITGTGRLGANNGFCSSATLDLGLSGAAVFDLAGFNQSLAGLTRKNANSALITNSATGSDSTLTLTTLTTNFPGVLADSGVAGGRIALVVSGGSHTLSGASTYTGNTTISAGTLNLTGSLGGTAVTNVAGTLTGTGVINGSVVVQSAATLNPGVSDSLGESLTINNNLTLAGTTIVQIGAAPACDTIAGVVNVNYGGTLIVTNATGATLAAGNTSNLFSASGTKLNNFSSVVLLPADPLLIPSFDPATGVLTLNSAAPPTLTFTNLGGSLEFSWTGGGTLQAQTNSLSVGLGTNWVDYPGSSPVTVPVDSANGSVFFRVKQ
jgi:autotransporter-associated beta strand protein